MLSRVADSLYWMSRYIERAENNARIADVNLQLQLDLINQPDSDPQQQWNPMISSLEENELFASLYAKPDGRAAMDFVSLQKKNRNSIYSCLAQARENARTTREQISSEMWEQINQLYLFVQSDSARRLLRSSPYEFFKRIVVGSHLFQGITHATMTHGESWHFMRIGRLLERADFSSRILDVKYHILLPSGERVGGNVDTIQWMSVLKSCSALEAYRKSYVNQVAPWKVAEFIITHAGFPRSIRFCVDFVDEALHCISGSDEARYANEAERLSGRLRSDLDYITIGEIFKFGLHEYLALIQQRLVEISNAIFDIYCASTLAADEENSSG
ncbi:MAG: alpha-E domain-containing protein [Verrucomicrobiota bacterium]|nr:alpha-E domain-containing protein [Verrucomicrobiota bacterium]